MNAKENLQNINKENRDIISLAVKCKFISFDEEDKILTHLFTQLQTDQDASALHLFEELQILTKEEIEFLLAIKGHLEVKMLDKRFGRLAVANNFISLDAIKKGLNKQSVIFKKKRENRLLGNILVDGKKMTEPDRTAIMLTQDRIKDEFLQDAMNKLARTELERMAINKRFGTIAVKMGFISIDMVNKALTIQKNEVEQGLPRRNMSDILGKSCGLKPDQALEVFKEQKLVEKRRLSLESALNKYNSEVKINRMLSKLFEYSVSKDKLEAFVRINKTYSKDIRVHSLKNWIKLAGIQFGLVEDDVIQAFLVDGTKGSELKIAKGVPAVEGRDATIEFCFDIEASKIRKKKKGGPARPFVTKGDVLAKRVPHKEGKPGTNVFGRVIYPRKLKTWDLGCGKGVAAENGEVYSSDIDGYPMLYQERTLFVTPKQDKRKTLTFTGNVEPGMGDSYRKINLEVSGNVSSGATLVCHQLVVSGDILGTVKATGDVDIRGGIGDKKSNGQGDGLKAVVISDGNINISKNVINAEVNCGKFFQAVNSDVLSSDISASDGLFAKNIYANGSGPCTLTIGKRVNHGLHDLNQKINVLTKELRKLKRSDELDELEHNLHTQIQAQDEFREKQTALTYLTKIMGDLDLENVDSLGPGFDFMETPAQEEDGQVTYGIPKKTKAYEYLQKVQDEIEELDPKMQMKAVQDKLTKNLAIYRTAVGVTERMEKEFEIQTDLINKEVENEHAQISKKEKKLETLKMERDFLLLEQEMGFSNKIPEIRIKNQVSEGTVIQGKHSKRVIDKTVYGVKLFETKNNGNDSASIVIKGYYE